MNSSNGAAPDRHAREKTASTFSAAIMHDRVGHGSFLRAQGLCVNAAFGRQVPSGSPAVLAPQAVSLEHWHLRDQIRVAQDAQHRRHEQVRRGETILEIVPPAEPAGQVREPPFCRLDRAGRRSFAHASSA